jgi:hypothetical protein
MSRTYDYGYDNDYDENAYSGSNRQKVNKVLTETTDDKMCFKIKRYDTETQKDKTIILFGSGDQGATIRNAVTGEKYYGHRVGSKNEDRYFKTRLSTGELGLKNSVLLFYESIEQYERHMTTKLDKQIKVKFAINMRKALENENLASSERSH